MMAADYRHIGGRENRLGRHYSRFSPFWPTPALSGQSLALRKLCDAGSNRRSQARGVRTAPYLFRRIGNRSSNYRSNGGHLPELRRDEGIIKGAIIAIRNGSEEV